jgi:CRP/FNR family transcriptional regulator, cyclic AMP receptor protein
MTSSPSATSSAEPPSNPVAEPGSGAGRDELVVPKGTVIFRQGDRGDAMFLIRRGRVRILLEFGGGHEADVAVLETGAFFGELSLLSEVPRTATAEALEDSTLLVVRSNVFAMMMQDDIDIVLRMLHTMGERLGRTDRQFREILERHNYLRLLAVGLGQGGLAPAGAAAPMTVERLAAALALDDATTRQMIDEVTRRGAGALESDCWRLEGAEQVAAALALLSVYADERVPT